MHYNVLLLLLFSLNAWAQPYYTPMFPPPFMYMPQPSEPIPDEDYEKDRGIYHSRYDNEYTALPETHQPDSYTIDVEPINPYRDTEIIIMNYD